MIYLLVTGLLLYTATRQSTLPAHTKLAYMGHGLRVFVDPDTRQFIRPEDIPTNRESQFFIGQVAAPMNKAIPPLEQPSTKTGGGYNIDLRQQFRPNREISAITQADS